MPHYYYCEQRSDEWYRLRLGVATASDFNKLITPGGKPAKGDTTRAYMYRLISQRLIQRDEDAMIVPTLAMERGMMSEQSAVDFYHLMGEESKPVGFVLADNGLYGCSPDRLVGEDGILEIKCPTAAVHTGYLDRGEIEEAYWPQVQGQLYVTGRKWSDWMSYHAEIRPVIVRTERDENYISKLAEALDIFCAEYMDCLHRFVEKGYVHQDVLKVIPS